MPSALLVWWHLIKQPQLPPMHNKIVSHTEKSELFNLQDLVCFRIENTHVKNPRPLSEKLLREDICDKGQCKFRRTHESSHFLQLILLIHSYCIQMSHCAHLAASCTIYSWTHWPKKFVQSLSEPADMACACKPSQQQAPTFPCLPRGDIFPSPILNPQFCYDMLG